MSRVQIEQRVGDMLQYLLPEQAESFQPPNLEKIAEVLQSKYNVHFSTKDELGAIRGNKILGMFTVEPLTIHVCSTLTEWSSIFRRTFAHELGHLVLHRKLLGKGKYISKEKPIIDTFRQLKYRETAELSDLGWAEWQANEFAMSLLLPRKYMQMLVIKAHQELGISHNIGTVYLDDQPINKMDFHRVIHKINQASGAKVPLIKRKLRFLGILEDHRKKRSQSVFESLDALFEVN